MTTQDKNAEIARWMGAIETSNETYPVLFLPIKDSDEWFAPDELKYHSDWNWLHQAIGKISKLEETPKMLGWKRNNWTIFDSPIITAKLETTFDLVYQFVVWHNQQVKENPKP